MILLCKCAECGSDPQPGNVRAGIYTHALKSLKLTKKELTNPCQGSIL